MTDPILVTSRDLAARLGISMWTLWKWSQDRADLRACKFSRSLWKLAEVERVFGVRK